MATVNLGKIKLVNRGTWASGTTYTADDIVQYTDSAVTSTYICVVSSSQGHTPSSSGTTHASWDFLAKGQDVLPSQSGQSGKYLTTNGSALSFGTVASDAVKLYSSGSTSGTSITWDNHYTSDYDVYKVYMMGMYTNGTGAIDFRFLNSSGNEISSSVYIGGRNDTGFETNDSNYHSGGGHRSVNQSYVELSDALSTTAAYTSNIEFTIWRPLANTIPTIHFWGDFWDGTTWAEHATGRVSYRSQTNGTRGGRVYHRGGNTIYIADLVVYGYKC